MAGCFASSIHFYRQTDSQADSQADPDRPDRELRLKMNLLFCVSPNQCATLQQAIRFLASTSSLPVFRQQKPPYTYEID